MKVSLNEVRDFKHNILRFIAIFAIVLVGMTFVSGIGALTPKIYGTYNSNFQTQNISDINIKTRKDGFTEEDINNLKDLKIEKDLDAFTQLDLNLKDSNSTSDINNYIVNETDDQKKYYLEKQEKDKDGNKRPLPFYVRYCFFNMKNGNTTLNKFTFDENGQKISAESGDNVVYVETENESLNLTKTELNNELDFSWPIESEMNGQKISFVVTTTTKLKVINKVKNPLYFTTGGETALTEDSGKKDAKDYPLRKIIYADIAKIKLQITNIKIEGEEPKPYYKTLIEKNFENVLEDKSILPKTDINLSLKEIRKKDDVNYTSSSYRKTVNEKCEKIRTDLKDKGFVETVVSDDLSDEEKEEKQKDDTVSILPLEKTRAYAYLTNVCDKVTIIAYIFPAFFIAIIALVVSTTMGRLITEDRPTIGTLKSLGYSNSRIAVKYFLFAGISTLLGGLVGAVIGSLFIPGIFIPGFTSTFIFPPKLSAESNILFGIICLLGTLAVVLLTTFIVSKATIREKPAPLFKGKAPKPGRKILLERIPFIWKNLPFRTKSTFRNVFRYVGRFLTVVVSTLCCTALVFAGFALNDVKDNDIVFNSYTLNISSTLSGISGAIIGFGVVLNILVLYNLINMVISERTKEIATLEVLGYRISEVCGYIFKELIIMVVIGAVIGTPVGLGFMHLVFSSMGFSSIQNIKWYTYLTTPALTIAAALLVELIFIFKIKKVDMNDSLKAFD